MSSDNQAAEALREQIAQAVGPLLHALTCQRIEDHPWEFCSMWPAPAVSAFFDAVLPVVQAHEKALRQQLADTEQARFEASTEERELDAELSSLRSRVEALADELDAKVRPAEAAAQRAHAISWPSEEAKYAREAKTFEFSARRLRSLLPQEGQQ